MPAVEVVLRILLEVLPARPEVLRVSGAAHWPLVWPYPLQSWKTVKPGGSSGTLIVGALHGQTTSSGTTLSGSGTAFDVANRSSSRGTYSGTFTPKSTIRINSSDGGVFSGTYDTEYDRPAVLSSVTGSFTGQGVSGNSAVQSIPLSIAADGTVTALGTQGCSAAGSLVPRPSGKNIFNVSVTFTGTNCALGNGTVTTGVGYYDMDTKRLLVLALNAAKTDGFIYIGSKAAPA